ncbi:S-adenosylmethionine decarboxylase related protein [Sporosarcina sp. FSL W8-0480]|uniref:S-adenosylmethionine decarboxylase related protein n=1 Tax=Sporosarcina sp. FSL W8-0480 TaxID=2954701 RepID=UPI0030D85BE3
MINWTSFVSISILGSGGGLAKAVLSILNQSVQDINDPIYPNINKVQFHLIDSTQKGKEYYDQLFPNLSDKITLYQLDLNDVNLFQEHLKKTKTKIVIDLSWADTIEMLNCCNELGVFYINSALENTEVDEDESLYGFPLTERFLRFEKVRKNFTNTKAIIGSGMNPGIVQWMAIKLMKDNPGKKPLACYIVEHDDHFFTNKKLVKPNTLYTSWSVECFLDEAILSYPMYVDHQLENYFYNEVYEMEFKVRLGEKEFYGCLMPHEEVITLGQLFDMQIGFIYRVNEYTTKIIQDHLDNVDVLWDWNQQIIELGAGDVEGEDLVGVLLVYENHETFMYNVMRCSDIYKKFKTNATYFQVACGVYAGLSSIILDDFPLDIYYVDELLLNTESKYGKYLTYYMTHFITGENKESDGLLHQRLKWVR